MRPVRGRLPLGVAHPALPLRVRDVRPLRCPHPSQEKAPVAFYNELLQIQTRYVTPALPNPAVFFAAVL